MPTLPFTALNPDDGEYVDITSLLDAIRLFNTWGKGDKKDGERRYTFAQLAGIDSMLIDKSFQDVIRRKVYCERFHVSPFPGGFDDVPAWWMTALNVMDRAEAEASKYLRRKHG